jgi:hypothetical protein
VGSVVYAVCSSVNTLSHGAIPTPIMIRAFGACAGDATGGDAIEARKPAPCGFLESTMYIDSDVVHCSTVTQLSTQVSATVPTEL